jgi:hypothetical protein
MSFRRSSLATALVVGGSLLCGHTATAAANPRLEIGSTRIATKAAPLVISVQAPRRADLTLRVNGDRAPDAFDYARRRVRVAKIGASDHLRPGWNRIRVRAESKGDIAGKSTAVRVLRRALLANAGGDTGALAEAGVQLGAPPSGASATPTLRRRWRVIDRPDGADFTLRHRHRAQPVLQAATPGTYVLRLKAHRKGHPGASYDTVTAPISPPDPPIGAPVTPLDPQTGNIVIDGRSYGSSSDQTPLTYVVMERTTRAVVASGSVGADLGGILLLAGLADTYGKGDNYLKYLMIVNGTGGIPDSLEGGFSSILKRMGSDVLTPQNFQSLRAGQHFFAVGIPGAPAGAATTWIPEVSSPPVTPPATYYLQKNLAVNTDGTPIYDLVSPEHPTFDTRAAGSTDKKNVMIVDGRTYEADISSLAGATAGLHALVLERLDLRPIENLTLVTNSSAPGSTDRDRQAAAASKLKQALDEAEDPILLLQTIGKPKAAGPEWAGIVDQVGRVGANRQDLNALDGTAEYAVVGRVGSDQPPAEATTAYDHGPYGDPHYPAARLSGALSRTRSSSFEPTVASTPTAVNPAGVNLDLIRTVYQAPQAWPQLAPGHPRDDAAAAEQWICDELGFCQQVSSCPDMRSCYWQKYGLNWADVALELSGKRWPGLAAGFDKDTFDAVKGELITEMAWVDQVKTYIDTLQAPFGGDLAKAQLKLKDIGETIQNYLKPPENRSTTSFTLGLVSKALLLGEILGPPVAPFFAGVSAAFGLAAFLSDDQGQPILGSEITTKAKDLGAELSKRFDLARQELTATGKILVSDYGKLDAANKHIKRDWALDPNPLAHDTTFQKAAQQWFYEALVPTAYPYLIRGNASNARDLVCPDGASRWFGGQPDENQMGATVGYDGDGKPIRAIFFFTNGRGLQSAPPASLGNTMFRPRGIQDNPGLGMEKLSFFTPSIFGNQIFHAVNGVGGCSVAFLPWRG